MDNPRLSAAFKLMQNKELLDGNLRVTRLARNANARRYMQERRRTDPGFRILMSLRTRLRTAVRAQNAPKRDKTQNLIGCPIDQLKTQLEAQFRDGMTWLNYGQHWHIDHIRPCCSFDLLDPEQYQACFHHSNLQPLLAQENYIKGGRWNG